MFRGAPAVQAPAVAGLYPPRIACFVCGAEVPADYPLYPLPPIGNNQATTPHFPFLLSLEPPIGCRPPSPGGVAKSCRVCYSTLMRQWDEYEKGGVATDRRVYYVKRVEGLPFPTAEAQARLTHSRKRVSNLMLAPASIPASVTLHPVTFDERLKASSPLTVATSSALGSSSSPLATPIVPLPHSSPSSSGWSRRPMPAQSASSAPSSLFQLSSERGDSSLVNVNVSETDIGALDLSSGSRDRENMKSRSSVASHISHHSSSYQSEGTSAASSSSTNVLTGAGTSTATVTEILDLTLPDSKAASEVCYVCGDDFKKGTLAYTFVKQVAPSEPFYPSLTNHPRPSRSHPIDAAGRVKTCDDCHEHLLAQWQSFEAESMPHADRQYSLRKRQVPSIDLTTFVCYICALEYHSSSLRLLYSKPNTDNEPYYPFISQQKAPVGASPISPQGMVQVCDGCYKSTKQKHHGFGKADQPPPKKRRGNSHTFSLPRDPVDYSDPSLSASASAAAQDEDEKTLPADVTCPLCRRKFSIGTFKVLHCQPHAGAAYFPFLSELPMPEDYGELEDDKQTRVRACQVCSTSLINQWSTYQRDQVPIEERTYVYESPLGPRAFPSSSVQRPPTPSSLRSHRSNRSVEQDKLAKPVLDPIQQQVQQVQPSVVPEAEPLQPVQPSQPQQHPKKPRLNSETEKQSASSFYCFLCGLHSDLSFSRMLYSSAPGKKAPYFPFMKKHVPKNRAETLREDGTALVCTFCYHSVMVQWSRYNEVRSPYVEPSDRTYNLHEYRCFVCGIMTYRKRIRALRVCDFPFLRHHKPRKNVIMMENGEMVAVCLDCFENLRGQFIEAGKYGIPIEKRQYNWIQVPPPPESEATALITAQERLSKFARPALAPGLPPPPQVSSAKEGQGKSSSSIVHVSGTSSSQGATNDKLKS